MLKNDLLKKLEDYKDFLYLKEYEKNTIGSYIFAVKMFIDFISSSETELRKNLLLKYKEYLENLEYQKGKKYEQNTLNKYIISINKFLKYIDRKDCCINKIKKQDKYFVEYPITAVDHKRMLRWAIKLNMDDTYLMMKLFALAGPRYSTLKYITVENVKSNFINCKIKGKVVYIILREDLRREIIRYAKKKKIESGLIFFQEQDHNKLICNSTLNRRLKRIACAAKISPKKAYPHNWRHLFAVLFMSIPGHTIQQLADLMGHNNINTTRIYLQLSLNELKKELEKIKI